MPSDLSARIAALSSGDRGVDREVSRLLYASEYQIIDGVEWCCLPGLASFTTDLNAVAAEVERRFPGHGWVVSRVHPSITEKANGTHGASVSGQRRVYAQSACLSLLAALVAAVEGGADGR